MSSIKIEEADENECNAENTSFSDTQDQANDMQLLSLLREIDEHNYVYTFERCKMFNINARQLRYLEKEHIRSIIPADQVGILAEFEYFHSLWKNELFAASPITTAKPTDDTSMKSMPQNNTTTTRHRHTIDPTSDNSDFESMDLNHSNERERSRTALEGSEHELDPHFFALKDIIRQDLRKVQAQYKKNGFLVERDRRILSSALVEYFRRRSIHMNKYIMESLAVQISEHFPTESKNAWHDTSVPNRRRGRLCLRLYNTQRKRPPTDKQSPNTKNSIESKSSDVDKNSLPKSSDDCEDAAQQIQQWLKENKCGDNYELIRIWNNTTSI